MPGAVETGLRRMVLGGYGLLIRRRRMRRVGEPRELVGARPELQQRHADFAEQRSRRLGRGASPISPSSRSGLASIILFLPLAAWGWHFVFRSAPGRRRLRLFAWPAAVIFLAAAMSALPQPKSWPLPNGLGGIFGDFFMAGAHVIGPFLPDAAVVLRRRSRLLRARHHAAALRLRHQHVARCIALWAPRSSIPCEWANASLGAAMHVGMHTRAMFGRFRKRKDDDEDDYVEEDGEEQDWPEREFEPDSDGRIEPSFDALPEGFDDEAEIDEDGYGDDITEPNYNITRSEQKSKKKRYRPAARSEDDDEPYETPPFKLLQSPPRSQRGRDISDEVLQENARELEGVLQDFGVKGEITNVQPRSRGHAVRARARARHQVIARHRSCRRHRPVDERGRRARGRGARP